jgi:Fe-S cluster assembly protein SufD
MTALHNFLIAQKQANEAAPEWLSSLQQVAFSQLKNRGLPSAQDEEWRLTRLTELYKQEFRPAIATNTLSLQETLLTPSAGSRIVFVNGVLDTGLSDSSFVAGLSIEPLEQAVISDKLNLETFFNASPPLEQHGFLSANTAFSKSGYVIRISADSVIDNPIEIIFIANNTGPAAWHCRNIIVADQFSKATIIERHVANDTAETYLSNCVTELHLADGSHLDFYKYQDESLDAYHIGGVYSKQSRDSYLTTNNIAIGSKIARTDIYATLSAEGAHCEMNGLSVLAGDQHVDNCTEVIHAKPNCTSDEYYKSVLDDQARSVFRGRIIVAKDAQKTDANQQNKNLLLSSRAEADTKPQLEIYADDVKCAHGATVGQLEEKSVFYLRSRGISETMARALLTFAFANDVIRRFHLPDLQKQLSAQLADRILGEAASAIETDSLFGETS